jgi:hypothetical protein
MVSVEQSVKRKLAGETDVLRQKTCPIATPSTTNPTRPTLRSNSAAVVVSWQLTAWAMEWPLEKLYHIFCDKLVHVLGKPGSELLKIKWPYSSNFLQEHFSPLAL